MSCVVAPHARFCLRTQLADLLSGFEAEDGSGGGGGAGETGVASLLDDDDGVGDTDWDAIMRAAEEAAPEQEEHQSPPLAQPSQLPSQSKPRTFADCFATQPSFASSSSLASIASCSSAVSANTAPSPLIPKKPLAAAASSAPAAAPRALSTRGVAFGTAAPVAVATSSAASAFIKEANEDLRDPISSFKVTNRLISSVTLREKLVGSKVVSISEVLRRKAANPRVVAPSSGDGGAPTGPAGGAFGILGNWVMFGVLTHKSLPKPTSTGKGKFVVWTLSDLDGHHVTVLLFGKAFEAYWKIPDGAVLALANAEDSSSFGSRGGSSFGGKSSAPASASVCVSLKFAGQVLEVGAASDFAFCKAFKNEQTAFGPVKGMARCKNVVNLSKGEYCEYHVKAEYKKLMNARPDLNQSRDARPMQFPGPAVPPAKTHQATTARIGAHMERSGIMARKDATSTSASSSGGGGEKKSLSALLLQAQSTRNARKGGSVDGKSLLYTREAQRSDEAKAEQAAKWTALSEKSTLSSRFLQRVVASSTGQSTSLLTTKESGFMAVVDKIKQEQAPAGGSAAKAPAPASATPSTPAVSAGTPRSRPVSAGAAAIALARKDPATALAQFNYVAKHPLQPPPAASPVPLGPPVAEAARLRGAGATALYPTIPKKPGSAPLSTPPSAPSARPVSAAASPAASVSSKAPATPSISIPPRPLSSSSSSSSSSLSTSTPLRTPAASFVSNTPTAPQPSPSAFLKAFGGGVAAGEGLVPVLGRGWVHSGLTPSAPLRPSVLNAGERRKQAQQAALVEQVAQLRAAGLLNKPDPNSTATPRAQPPGTLKRKSMDPPSLPQTGYALNVDGSISLTQAKPTEDNPLPNAPPEESRAEAKRSKLAAAFGQKYDSASVDRILSQSSAHADLVHESASSVAAQEALFDLMERKESMAVQLNAITQQAVKGFRCAHPGCYAPVSEFPLAACKTKGHRLERVDLQKRFFTCQQCKFHISTLQAKLPTHACHKCGCTVWIKASMMPLKVDSSDRHLLQIRSEETELRVAF